MKQAVIAIICTLILCATLYVVAQQFRNDIRDDDRYFYYRNDSFSYRVDKETGETYKAKRPYGWYKLE